MCCCSDQAESGAQVILWGHRPPCCSVQPGFAGLIREHPAVLAQDFEQGSGVSPQDGQEVTFQYTAYNESGNRIDSSYSKGRPASTRLGINGLIPGQDTAAHATQYC